ncbi:MAG: hypothetical protein K0R62_3237, partial [Nonomuraea muscovyensis]|nr:hypothetical protein [Nonomuraea muscovyensis]
RYQGALDRASIDRAVKEAEQP